MALPTDDMDALGAAVKGKSDDEIRALADASRGGLAVVLDALMERMRSQFDPGAAGDASAVIRYDLRLPDVDRSYALVVDAGRCELEQPARDEARVRLGLSAADFIRMNVGHLNMVSAFLKRRIKLKGDVAFARQTGTWFAGAPERSG